MKKNVGTIDALMRITIGLTGIAWGTSRIIRRPYSSAPLLITFASAMKVAEGITRYCPMLDMFNVSSENIVEKAQEQPIMKRVLRMKNQAQQTMMNQNQNNHNNQQTGNQNQQSAIKQQLDDFFEPQH